MNLWKSFALLVLSATVAWAQAQTPAEESCPLARQPYSIDTPLLDLVLNPKAREVLGKYGFIERIPPPLLETRTPNFLAIISARLVSADFGLSESTLEALQQDLAAIPVTAEDRRARCARYDFEPPHIEPPTKRPAILVFDKSVGFRHGEAIDAANALLEQIAFRRGWGFAVTSNAAAFEASLLEHFDAVVWNNVSGDVLTIPQRAALREFIEDGGGFVGIHGSGGDPLYVWDWYADELIGARFMGHPMGPQFQDARLVVEDRTSAITKELGAEWILNDEWYSFKESPRQRGARILVTIDESTYSPKDGARDLRMGEDHPIAWTRCVAKGRSFYTAIGHRPETYADAKATALLESGIAWAVGRLGEDCGNDEEVTK